MIGEMLRGSAAIMAMLSVNAQAAGHLLMDEGMQDGVCALKLRGNGSVGTVDFPCCIPARRAVPRTCPRA